MRFDKIPGHDPQGEFWQGYRWSHWYPFEDVVRPRSTPRWKDDKDGETFKAARSLYRIRVRRFNGLLYIGETGRTLKDRLRFHWQHYNFAAKKLRLKSGTRTLAVHKLMATLKPTIGEHRFEVSWTDVAGLPRDDRKGIEAELIAAYRAVMGKNPRGQWGGEEEEAHDA
jgi:hypothetical protein